MSDANKILRDAFNRLLRGPEAGGGVTFSTPSPAGPPKPPTANAGAGCNQPPPNPPQSISAAFGRAIRQEYLAMRGNQ